MWIKRASVWRNIIFLYFNQYLHPDSATCTVFTTPTGGILRGTIYCDVNSQLCWNCLLFFTFLPAFCTPLYSHKKHVPPALRGRKILSRQVMPNNPVTRFALNSTLMSFHHQILYFRSNGCGWGSWTRGSCVVGNIRMKNVNTTWISIRGNIYTLTIVL